MWLWFYNIFKGNKMETIVFIVVAYVVLGLLSKIAHLLPEASPSDDSSIDTNTSYTPGRGGSVYTGSIKEM
jgi:hypothetical protein